MPGGSQCDVCVIGAGPAGLAVASRLTERGREVRILERKSGRSGWGGETFTGAIRGPLGELGCWETFERAGHVLGYERQSAWGGEPRAENALFSPQGPLWHVDRDRFDADLREAVRRRGTRFESYGKLESIQLENGRWSVKVGEGRIFRARYLVDATGRRRTVSRRLGARIESHDRLIGLAARVTRAEALSEVGSMLLQATPFGWWYAAPVPDGHVLVLFTDPDLAPLEVRRRLRPTAANSVFTATEGAERWLAVGDACASHDPLCGWGVHRALSNGLLAGDAIDSFLASGDAAPVTEYRRHCREQFDSYLHGLALRYSLERRWPTAPFWARRHRSTLL
jgi:flavin-dependent dehydrogenase